MPYLCSHLIGQNLVTWPLLATKEAGKCMLYSGLLCLAIHYNFFTVKESENIHGVKLVVLLIFFLHTHLFIHSCPHSSNRYKYKLCRKPVPGAKGPGFGLLVVQWENKASLDVQIQHSFVSTCSAQICIQTEEQRAPGTLHLVAPEMTYLPLCPLPLLSPRSWEEGRKVTTVSESMSFKTNLCLEKSFLGSNETPAC